MKKKQNITPFNAKGEPHGEWIMYCSNGRLRHKGNYINGKEVGEWISYSSNGQLWFKGSYNNGKEIGMWKEWNSITKEYDNVFYG